MNTLAQLSFFLTLTLPMLGQTVRGSESVRPLASTSELNSLISALPPPLLFRADDTISAQIFGVKEFDFRQQVPIDGTVDFPLAGPIMVAGLTVQQVQQQFRERLIARGMLEDPQVTVSATKRPAEIVTVAGAVIRPGVFPAVAGLTLSDYLSQAGGFEVITSGPDTGTPIADSTVVLFRRTVDHAIVIPLGPNWNTSPYGRIPLFAGDELRVSRTGSVYAYGALKNQGVYPLKGDTPTTVLQLLALAGGMGYEADASEAYIVRTHGTTRIATAVPLKDLIATHQPGPEMMSDDILYVPSSKLRAAIKGGGSGLIVSLATAYLYKH